MISVIVPVYNVASYLPRCIESILQQTYNELEIILVDDGSTDGSSQICDAYAEKDKRVIAIHQLNKGVSHARNTGITRACGKYLGFVDGDDYIEKNMYAVLVDRLKKTESDIAMCGWYTIYGNKKLDKCHSQENMILTGEEKFASVVLHNEYLGFACNKLFCMHIIRKYNLRFDESKKLLEDLFFVCQYLKNCNTASTIALPLYNYVQRSDSAVKRKKNLEEIHAKVQTRNDVLKILHEQGCSILCVEEKAYQCLDAAEGVLIAQDYNNNEMEKYFQTIFLSNYSFIKQSRTLTKASRIKCKAMWCNKWIYRLLRKSLILYKMILAILQNRVEK